MQDGHTSSPYCGTGFDRDIGREATPLRDKTLSKKEPCCLNKDILEDFYGTIVDSMMVEDISESSNWEKMVQNWYTIEVWSGRRGQVKR